MNRERLKCDCRAGETGLLRIFASGHDGKISLGTYCPVCKRIRDLQGRELRPVVPLRDGVVEHSMMPDPMKYK